VVVAVGVTTAVEHGLEQLTAGDHEYVEAPDAVSVTGVPLHDTLDGLAVTVIEGGFPTVTFTVAVFWHPNASNPVTV
jgi:hypothetical protein